MTLTDSRSSIQKEQADNDFQNLVFCVMLERNVDLQSALDIVTKMLATRVDDYAKFKAQLPSFGAEVDQELATYFKALEHYVQGTVVWYYESPSMLFLVQRGRQSFLSLLFFLQDTSVAWTSPTRRTWLFQSILARQMHQLPQAYPPGYLICRIALCHLDRVRRACNDL